MMLDWVVIFLILALVAAFFGFGGVAAQASGIAQILFILRDFLEIRENRLF